MKTTFHVLLFAVLVVEVRLWVLPVEKCRLDNSSCMITAFQKLIPIFIDGIPELGVEKIDELDDILIDVFGLKLTLKNGTIKGFKNAIVDRVDWNHKKKYADVQYHMMCTLKGRYTATGKVFVLPIDGDGQLKVKLKHFVTILHLDYDIEKLSDGKDHIRPKNYSFQYEVKDHAEYQITNLFKGNKELSNSLLKFINENWKEVSNEFGNPVLEKLGEKVFKNIVSFFGKLAIDDIAIV